MTPMTRHIITRLAKRLQSGNLDPVKTQALWTCTWEICRRLVWRDYLSIIPSDRDDVAAVAVSYALRNISRWPSDRLSWCAWLSCLCRRSAMRCQRRHRAYQAALKQYGEEMDACASRN